MGMGNLAGIGNSKMGGRARIGRRSYIICTAREFEDVVPAGADSFERAAGGLFVFSKSC